LVFRYWDVELKPDEYSYVDAAVKKGYSVLTYDRLGTGRSEKPDAYDIVQVPTEVEILASLTKLARSGKLVSSSKVMSATTRKASIPYFQPSKVVQVGHSFGSYLIAGMLARYGNLTDGAILSSFLITKLDRMIDVLHYDHEFAREHDPVRFGEYPSGYFVLNTESCLQKLFFRKGAFDSEMLTYAERIKAPEAVGEYASEGTSPLSQAAEFRGPIQVSLEQIPSLWALHPFRGEHG
jgi:pimeloyl-ACP methyl ester carboxylesterase